VEACVLDFLYVVLGVGFLAGCALYVTACERL
jgi:hypothetical protein